MSDVKNTLKQGKQKKRAISPRSGTEVTDHQFGGPKANPRGWGQADVKLRAQLDLQKKLRQTLDMTHEELLGLYKSKDEPRIMQVFAKALHDGKLGEALALWHEVFGMPKEPKSLEFVEMPKPLLDREEIEKKTKKNYAYHSQKGKK